MIKAQDGFYYTGKMGYEKDNRLVQLEKEKQAALQETDAAYGALIDETGESYQALLDGNGAYEQEQIRQQNEQTEAAVAQLGQQKEQARKARAEEQAAAYADYQRQADPYGVEAEKLAGEGLAGSGYSESAKVSMYNTYQNRVALAREGYEQAAREYDAAIREAWQLNSAALAQIAYETLETRINLSLKAIERKSQLSLDRMEKKEELRELYDDREQGLRKQLLQEQTQNDTGQVSQTEQQLQLQEQHAKKWELERQSYMDTIRQLQDQIARLMTDQIPEKEASREGSTMVTPAAGGKSKFPEAQNTIAPRAW